MMDIINTLVVVAFMLGLIMALAWSIWQDWYENTQQEEEE